MTDPVEAAAIGALLYNQPALDDVREWLHVNDFGDPQHRAIYKAALQLRDRGEPADPATVVHELRQDQVVYGRDTQSNAYIATIYERTPNAMNARYYCREVVEMAVSRELEAAGLHLLHLAREAPGSAAERVQRARDEIWHGVSETSARLARAGVDEPRWAPDRDITSSDETRVGVEPPPVAAAEVPSPGEL